MSRWLRKLAWIALATAPFVFYIWFFGLETLYCLQAWRMGRQVPILRSVPVDLTDVTVSRQQGKKVSFRGAEFELPWADIDETKTKIVGNWLLVFLRSGNSMIVCVSPDDTFLKSIAKDQPMLQQLFEKLYGPQVVHSDYAMHKAILETTPTEITPITPVNRAAGLTAILLMKAAMPPTTDWAIYNVRSGDFVGFQLGSPARRPKKMCLEMFGTGLDVEKAPGITQGELNRMIQTLHKATSLDTGYKIEAL